MAVRLLVGPTTLKDVNGKPMDYLNGRAAWYPNVGLLVQGYQDMNVGLAGNGGVFLATLDGVIPVESFDVPADSGWWPARQRVIAWGGDSSVQMLFEYIYEPIAGIYQRSDPDDWISFDEGRNVRGNYIRLADRRIYVGSSDRIYAQVKGLPNAAESDVFPFHLDNVHPGRSETDIWVEGWVSPNRAQAGCFYDTVTKKIASPVYHIGMAASQLVYAPEFGVLVSVHPGDVHFIDGNWVNGIPNQINVWSLEVDPTILTIPKPIIGSSKSGQVVTYQTQLTGDSKDGAEGELVNWSLSGVGMLLDAQTKTDVNGYATARVVYGLAETGSSTVIASVLC